MADNIEIIEIKEEQDTDEEQGPSVTVPATSNATQIQSKLKFVKMQNQNIQKIRKDPEKNRKIPKNPTKHVAEQENSLSDASQNGESDDDMEFVPVQEFISTVTPLKNKQKPIIEIIDLSENSDDSFNEDNVSDGLEIDCIELSKRYEQSLIEAANIPNQNIHNPKTIVQSYQETSTEIILQVTVPLSSTDCTNASITPPEFIKIENTQDTSQSPPEEYIQIKEEICSDVAQESELRNFEEASAADSGAPLPKRFKFVEMQNENKVSAIQQQAQSEQPCTIASFQQSTSEEPSEVASFQQSPNEQSSDDSEQPLTIHRGELINFDAGNWKLGAHYICIICKKTNNSTIPYRSIKDLQRHVRELHTARLKCPLCSKKFENVFSLHEHLRLAHSFTPPQLSDSDFIKENNIYTCLLCSKKFKYRPALRGHMTVTHFQMPSSQPEYTIEYINEDENMPTSSKSLDVSFANDSRQEQCMTASATTTAHLSECYRKHDNYYICIKCEYSNLYDNAQRVIDHVQNDHEVKYKCKICQEIFDQKSFIQQHLQELHGLQKSKDYARTIQILNNYTEEAAKNNKPPNIMVNDTPYPIRYLNEYRGMSTRRIVIDSSNSVENYFICTICHSANRKKYRTQSSLCDHIYRRHVQQRFQCPDCTDEFITKDDIFRHAKQQHCVILKFYNIKYRKDINEPENVNTSTESEKDLECIQQVVDKNEAINMDYFDIIIKEEPQLQ